MAGCGRDGSAWVGTFGVVEGHDDQVPEARRWAGIERQWATVLAEEAKGDDLEAARWGATLRSLADQEALLRRGGVWLSGPEDLVDVLGLAHDEVRNCRVVRWLLDPVAPHGLGTLFLDAVLGVISARSPQAPPVFRNTELAEVHPEVVRGDTRADIVVVGPNREWTVLIEAKILAGEGLGQGRDLAAQWERDHLVLVFLTLDGQAMRSGGEEWVPLRWADLAEHLRRSLAQATPSPLTAGRHAAEEYLRSMERHLA